MNIRHPAHSIIPRGGRIGIGALAVIVMAGMAPAPAQPLVSGERLEYRVQVSRLGSVGRAAMWIEGPVEVRGSTALHLRFEVEARKGPLRALDRTESWLDPERMAALRFYKHERHPLSSHDEAVEIFPAQHRWESADGRRGTSGTDAPLDELSFLYFLRTLPLADGGTYRFDRHFEPDRNPITVRVLSRGKVRVPAGEFNAVTVEMRVRDPRHYKGSEGVLGIQLTDDDCRIPLRIESSLAVFGSMTLSLESHTHPASHFGH